MVQFKDAEEQKHIDFLHKREEEDLAQMLAQKYGVEYVDLTLVAINADALRLLTETDARNAEAATFGRVGKRVSLAARSPENPKVKVLVEKLKELGYEVVTFITSSESLKRAFERYADLSYATETKAGVFELSNQELEDLLGKVKHLEDVSKLIDEAIELKKTYPITLIL